MRDQGLSGIFYTMSSKTLPAIGLILILAGSCQTTHKAGLRPEALRPESPQPESLSAGERQDRFIELGYDAAPIGGDPNDYEAFVQAHGKPRGMDRKAIANPQDRVEDAMLTLSYARYELRYYVYSKRELWHPPKSLLMAVLSRPGGSYLLGIVLGMDEGRVLDILGLAASEAPRVDFENAKGHRVRLTFSDGTLSSILWDYSSE